MHAGMPILDVLRHEKLENVCCVVTRYFRRDTARHRRAGARLHKRGAACSRGGGRQRMSLYSVLLIACPYHLYEMVTHLLRTMTARLRGDGLWRGRHADLHGAGGRGAGAERGAGRGYRFGLRRGGETKFMAGESDRAGGLDFLKKF